MTQNAEKEDCNTECMKKINIETNHNIIRKIQQHIFVRKACMGESKISKQSWAEEAIKEKLENERDIHSCLLKNKSFTFLLSNDLEKEIEERIKIIKKFSRSSSRKKWLLDAFLQKIENERDEIKKHLDSSIEIAKKNN